MNEKRFDGMGSIYANFRPSYPKEFIGYLYNDVGLTDASVIADIGSGTGILTKQLLEEGNTVYAIEPNADMRKKAEQSLGLFDLVISVCGSAENTTLQNESVDFITVAQAFHWFDRQQFKTECRRILVPNGKVILVWNSRDNKSGLVIENDMINKRYCPEFKGFSGGMRGAADEDDLGDFFEGSYEYKVFKNDLTFDENGFIGRNLSSSYAPKEADANYQHYLKALQSLFGKYSTNGFLVMPNLTRSYIGRV